MKEEIIKNAKEIVYNAECWIDDEEYTGAEEREWAEFEKNTIQGLLDLYNREKEKNKKLQKEIEALEIIHSSYKEMIEQNDYIDKDKIKEKIKEISDGTYDAKIILQKLLEE